MTKVASKNSVFTLQLKFIGNIRKDLKRGGKLAGQLHNQQYLEDHEVLREFLIRKQDIPKCEEDREANEEEELEPLWIRQNRIPNTSLGDIQTVQAKSADKAWHVCKY